MKPIYQLRQTLRHIGSVPRPAIIPGVLALVAVTACAGTLAPVYPHVRVGGGVTALSEEKQAATAQRHGETYIISGHYVAAVGARLPVVAAWYTTCQHEKWPSFESFSKTGETPVRTDCEFKPTTLHVTCRGPCDVEPPQADHGYQVSMVTAREVGTIVIESDTTRTDTGQAHHSTYTIDVRQPDLLELQCLDIGVNRSCEQHPVAATQPFVYLKIGIGRYRGFRSELLRINGQPVTLGNRGRLSLATLFPDHATGNSVFPGPTRSTSSSDRCRRRSP